MSPCHLLLALTLLLAACTGRENPTSQPASRPATHAASRPADTLITGEVAPDFTLDNAHGGSVTLSKITQTKPVILVFYLGYTCPRCVSHLRGLANDYDEIQKLGAEVLAISTDSVATTKDSTQEFGDFPFPILSDPDNKVFALYNLVLQNTDLLHGCFIIDTHRKLRFIRRGDHPFEDTDAVLEELRQIHDQPVR